MGRKPSDWFTVSLCRDHHAEQHNIGEGSFASRHGLNLFALRDEFAKASPKARDIEAKKRERANG